MAMPMPDEIVGLLRSKVTFKWPDGHESVYGARDLRLAASVRRRTGVRVPGAFDGFETAVRAVLGQQVSVRAATTLAADDS